MAQKAITILTSENMAAIISEAPTVLQSNKNSSSRCMEFGAGLYEKVCEQGMNDELDSEVANYIERSRKTVKAMNERRSAVTKLFDTIRSEFTSLENKIDPAKSGSIAYSLQALRNQYAKRKHEEEERKRREKLMELERAAARNRLENDIETYMREGVTKEIREACSLMEEKYNGVNHDNCVEVEEYINSQRERLSDNIVSSLIDKKPESITSEEYTHICEIVLSRIWDSLSELYESEIRKAKKYFVTLIPDKLKFLSSKENDVNASMKSEQEEIERRQREQREAELKKLEEEQKDILKKNEAKKEMDALFSKAQASVSIDGAKVKVSKKIVLSDAKGILPIISMWWSKEGCNLSVDELTKMFKKQITFCERLANKSDELIMDDSVSYVDNVTAK